MMVFFFFSSRRRHTRCSRDWSSDVCSSDLVDGDGLPALGAEAEVAVAAGQVEPLDHARLGVGGVLPAGEHEGLVAVVDDELAGADRGRDLGPDIEAALVVVGADEVAFADLAGGGV